MTAGKTSSVCDNSILREPETGKKTIWVLRLDLRADI
jgi:hypothetical protein